MGSKHEQSRRESYGRRQHELGERRRHQTAPDMPDLMEMRGNKVILYEMPEATADLSPTILQPLPLTGFAEEGTPTA